jgi:hypothetical protein
MSDCLIRPLLMLLSMTLILIESDCAVQAQPLQNQVSAESSPSSEQSASSLVIPTSAAPARFEQSASLLRLSDNEMPSSPEQTSPLPPAPSNEAPLVPEQTSPPSPQPQQAPAKPPRRFRNSIGIGGSIGISGIDTGLSEGGLALLTKNELNDFLAIRGTNVFGSTHTDNTIALTANVPIRSRSGTVRLIPFIGGGLLVSSKYSLSDIIIRGLVTGGIDLPLSRRFTATTQVNVGFTKTTNVGVQLGLSYSF